MRRIEITKMFKRDYQRVQATPKYKNIEALLRPILNRLVVDEPLPRQYSDHPLIGNWSDHRDCHIKPDLILIYCKPNEETLQLVRLGSHSALGF
jgi:mRNA interferase YafQ